MAKWSKVDKGGEPYQNVYRVDNLHSMEEIYISADSREEAVEKLGWSVGDCLVTLVYVNKKRGQDV